MKALIIVCVWDGVVDYSDCEWNRFVMTVDGVITASSIY